MAASVIGQSAAAILRAGKGAASRPLGRAGRPCWLLAERKMAGCGAVTLGQQIHRWDRVKRQLRLQSDEALARTLLDVFVKVHMCHACPGLPELDDPSTEAAAVTRATQGKGDSALHASPFWPVPGAGKMRRLAARPPPWQKGRPDDSKPKGRRSRSGRSARHGASGGRHVPTMAACESAHRGQDGERLRLARLPVGAGDPGGGTPRRAEISIGQQEGRWHCLKARLDLKTDEDMAKVLLDVFIENQMDLPGPSWAFLEDGPDERTDFICHSVPDQDDVDSYTSLSLSAGSESTVTLSHPSSMDSFEEEGEAEAFGSADWQCGGSRRLLAPGRGTPRPPASINHEAGWEPGSGNCKLEPPSWWSSGGTDPKHKEAQPFGPSSRLPKALERQSSSDREIIAVCIGEESVLTIKEEQEDSLGLPSPVASAFSGTTVTLSHPSSDVSLEEEWLFGAAAVSGSETEGAGIGRKRAAIPDSDSEDDGGGRWDVPGMLDIGAEIDRWRLVKGYLKVRSDEEVAKTLLDLYLTTHASPPQPRTPIPVCVMKL